MTGRYAHLLAPLALVAVCCGDGGGARSEGGRGEGGMAVVCSDYSSSSVSLLGPGAESVVAPEVIDSGARAPGVRAALSGDVAVSTTRPGSRRVVLIDRGQDVLTWLEPASGAVERQVGVGRTFRANPHDVAALPDGRWVVSRYAPNPDPSPDRDLDAGDDLLVLGPQGGRQHALALGEGDAPARPDRIVRRDPASSTLWVSLGRVGRDFRSWRTGAVARVRVPPGERPELLGRTELDGTRNCVGLATDGERVAVTCVGPYEGTAGNPRQSDPAGSAVVLLGPDGEERNRLSATDPRVSGAFGFGLAFGPDGAVHAVVFGDDDRPDRVLAWDPGRDEVEVAYEAAGSFTVSWLATDASGRIVVPEGDREDPTLCVLDAGGPACLNPCPRSDLPPRQAVRYVEPHGGEERWP